MTTPASWFRHALEALRHEEKSCECDRDLYEKVPAWTAEDEINLARRVVAAQEAREAAAEAYFLRPIGRGK